MSLPFQSTKGFKGFLELTNGLKKEDGKIQLNYNSNHFESDSNGQLQIKNNIVNVKDFGAKGDGQTNDQPAIQNAVDSLPEEGGTVYIPSGKYNIELVFVTERETWGAVRNLYGGIILPDNVRILGDGYTTHICLADNQSTDYFSIGLIVNKDPVEGNSYIAVEKVRLDGNRENQPEEELTNDPPQRWEWECINFDEVDHYTIKECYVENAVGEGVDCDNSPYGYIIGNDVRNCGGFGLHITRDKSSNCYIAGNYTYQNGYERITETSFDGGSIDVKGENNVITGHLSIEDYSGILLIGSGNKQNMVTNSRVVRTGKKDGYEGSTSKSYGIRLLRQDHIATGNIIEDCAHTAIECSGLKERFIISNNLIQGGDVRGINGDSSRYCTVTGNIIRGVGFQGIRRFIDSNVSNNFISDSVGTSISQCHGVITGNIVKNAGDHGITTFSSVSDGGTSISNNHIDGTGDHGILIDSTSDDIVTSNYIKGAGNDSIHEGGTNTVIANNQIV